MYIPEGRCDIWTSVEVSSNLPLETSCPERLKILNNSFFGFSVWIVILSVIGLGKTEREIEDAGSTWEIPVYEYVSKVAVEVLKENVNVSPTDKLLSVIVVSIVVIKLVKVIVSIIDIDSDSFFKFSIRKYFVAGLGLAI